MTSAPTLASPLLDRPGAVPGDGPDAGVARHYGDPLREQRALVRGAGWVDRSTRGVIAVPGPDRLSWLHSITSQHLSALADGTGTEGLVLSPHGHVEQHFVVAELAGTTWLDTEPGTAPALLAYLDSMRFLLRVEPRDATAELAVLTVAGPDAAAVLTAAGLPAPSLWAVVPLDGGGFARRTREHEVDLLVPRAVAGRGRRPAHRGRGDAGRHLGVRGGAGRGPPPAARLRDRPPHDPARGRLDRHRGAPGQGLLPRSGDGGPGAQPGPAAAPAGAAAPVRRAGRAAPAGHPAAARRAHGRLPRHRRPAPRAGPGRAGRGEAHRRRRYGPGRRGASPRPWTGSTERSGACAGGSSGRGGSPGPS